MLPNDFLNGAVHKLGNTSLTIILTPSYHTIDHFTYHIYYYIVYILDLELGA